MPWLLAISSSARMMSAATMTTVNFLLFPVVVLLLGLVVFALNWFSHLVEFEVLPARRLMCCPGDTPSAISGENAGPSIIREK